MGLFGSGTAGQVANGEGHAFGRPVAGCDDESDRIIVILGIEPVCSLRRIARTGSLRVTEGLNGGRAAALDGDLVRMLGRHRCACQAHQSQKLPREHQIPVR
jgi:hypothetical protein